MPSWLPSIPYPPPDQPGYWDPVTSTLQWCEEDYYATYYSAEIINTLTNLMFIYLAYKGVKSCRNQGHDTVFEVAYFGYFLVGFGSFMFHTTLKYPWQLVDELNMIYTTCLMAYASLSYSRPATHQVALGLFLLAFCAAITLYYHYLQDPVFHQTVYAFLTLFIVLRSLYSMEFSLRPSLRQTEERHRLERVRKGLPVMTKEEQDYENKRDMEILRTMWFFVVFGVSIFLAGFGIWNLDNQYCSTLRKWRRELGMPWGFFLEGHGWWHLMTGIGAYFYILWAIHLRHVLNGDQEHFRLVWDRFFQLPEVVRISDPPSKEKNCSGAINGSLENGHANGNTKKTK
ncbi:alkaline ceramidase ydc1 [Knufia peltigerae]|uniref:Alkaline ceramidase ydc1 n=1 Tax=Knufia peltigerae TaxID=1002370 RepID=A0AA39CQF8_9EURO|nr:alkaline ceramidase ydc1 [Knufia peltigerae]